MGFIEIVFNPYLDRKLRNFKRVYRNYCLKYLQKKQGSNGLFVLVYFTEKKIVINHFILKRQ